MKSREERSESSIQARIADHLSHYGNGMVFRTNAGDFYQGKLIDKDTLTNLRHIKGLPAGFSDLLFVGYDGHVAFIEVKVPGGRIRKDQLNFLSLMQSYGYAAGIAHSETEALSIVQHKSI